MSDTERRDILERGLASPFWALFRAHIERECGSRFESVMEELANRRDDDAEVLSRMRQAAVARREMLRMLKWPEDELKKLSHEPPVQAAGRGTIDEALAIAMGRRGSL